TDDLGSLLELQSSGRTSIIRNTAVSKSLSRYLLTRSRARDSQAQISKLVTPLTTRHPDLIRVTAPTIVDESSIEPGEFSCDLSAMRASQQFLIDLEIAQTSFGHHVHDNARVDESLEQLKDVLDQVLGIEAEEEAAP
ncbi:MAG: hypothetical protein WA989_03505, partial [Henriciella sp.]|uniref:hypothetical protein n=1 Tax=Henriciella sp. TaxID=1968823 RepID=UPI003C78275C